ncbi:Bicarbonate transporter BicA [Candidatus Terasakiella magnetica]|uniref:Bicarbonate transporter BicA n=1 Tax=Candidatus Terasakiella magnetica TaxID=1867952 RepID=A0A1C3RIJ0_9PROT|nr:SulP family inorganic anion transporter [Candidatus Terasakiella magnetica]SCA57081.1 Bicarbonate transporter BicA [Candidatus Terasakiella magnetica]
MFASFRFDNIKGDIYGGITAGVVALPLALAFGVASGAGAMAGLYGAIIVGFFASVFGGTPAQVSGPTGPMTVVMTAVIMQYIDQPGVAFTIVMMGGLFQIGFGLAKIGKYVSFVPFSVISGFMSGIGVIIILIELAPLLGHSVAQGGTVGALAYLPTLLSHIHVNAALVGLLSLGIMIFCPKALANLIPPALVALIFCTALVFMLDNGVPIIGEIPTGLPSLILPTIIWPQLIEMITAALMLALLGTIDSLLTSLIADNMTKTKHKANKELIGQGIGNALAGLFGAIPGAGATMRTVVNIRAGGRTPLAGVLHSALLLAIVLGLGGFASHIPHAVLAGILIKVGWDIIDWPFLKVMKKAPQTTVFLTFSVLTLTVFVDLVIAVGFGVVAASLITLQHLTSLQLETMRGHTGRNGKSHLSQDESDKLEALGDRVFYCHFGGHVTFGAAHGIMERLVPEDQCDAVILDLGDIKHLDITAAYALQEIIEGARDHDVLVMMVGMHDHIAQKLETMGVLEQVDDVHIHLARSDCFVCANDILSIEENGNPKP